MNTNGKAVRPFWQTIVLTLITSIATGAGTYYAARQDVAQPATVAQQAVRVDMVWDACKALNAALEARVDVLERDVAPRHRPTAPAKTMMGDKVPTPAPNDPRVGAAQRSLGY